MTNEEPTVFIVDDDGGVSKGIERLLRQEGLRTKAYQSPRVFLAEIDPSTSGCLLLDLSLPEMTGLDVQDQLLAAGVELPIVFMSGYGTVQASVRAMKAGAVDFIEKPVESSVLVTTVKRAIERDALTRLQRSANLVIEGRLASLTPRESQVLRHVISGHLNKQIAAQLGTAEKTVKVHRARVMRKMSVRSVAELTRVAMAVGVQPET